jgi:NADH-quinone oxidoreductase subunit G
MVEIEIDGKKVEVPPGSMVMDAANKLGTYIPHFCYHKKLSIAANCRMCLVEVEKAPKPLPACATPVSAGMIVRSASDKAVRAQKDVMEFLLINHPLDCPICDQGGECQLQDLAVGYGGSKSRYAEEKRVVFMKEAGPLLSMKEMQRCIHCTRCVRFGQEIAGMMELGMLGRGEHAEITSFVNSSVDSELSGNMIDLCPVGAILSKPFRYTARTWELGRRKSVSPHDSLGSNLIVQVKNHQVMRMLPLENEEINECWLSDKDRFAYTGLHTEERLNRPMIKQGGEWQETDWQTALEYVAHGLKNIKHEHGADAIAAYAAPLATLEELSLLNKTVRGLGSEHIDFRLRQSDFANDGKIKPWLGMPIAEVGLLDRAFIVGSFLRKDHPLLATRLRAATKMGAQVTMLHASDDDNLLASAGKLIAAPSAWLAALAELARAVAAGKGVSVVNGAEGAEPSDAAKAIAASLLSGERRAVFLGNAAVQHPQAAQIHALAQWIAEQAGATLGVLTEGGNTVGGYVVGATAGKAEPAFKTPRKAYVLLHAEPEFDTANPQAARAALQAAEMVVVMSPFRQGLDYADVLLPVSPYTETSGTFVNAEGRAQSFNGSCKPHADTRPAWKVLRVLGNLLGLAGFDYETSEAIRDEVLQGNGDLRARLNNASSTTVLPVGNSSDLALERLADVPIHFTDAIVRRAAPLQRTADARAPKAVISAALAGQLGIADGDTVRVTQNGGSAQLVASVNAKQAANVIRVAAGHATTAGLGAMFGPIAIEKATGAQ